MVTLKDVARETGLTVSTVSRVLNNRGYISKEAKAKVSTAMNKLNYQPNEVARSLSKQKTNTIGVIVPNISHPYFAQLVSYLENQAYLQGKKILLFNSKDKDEKQKEYLSICSGSRVSGIVLCSGNVPLEEFYTFDIPIITIERSSENRTTAIECDNFLGGKLAAQHLIECGCHQLIYFNVTHENAMPADTRVAGFEEICIKENIGYKEIRFSISQKEEIDYYKIIEKVLKDNPKVDGIFASSDVIAAQILQVCHMLHIEIPSQLKLIGFDDINISMFTVPKITTIHQPLEEMARMAIDYLVNADKGYIMPNRTVLPVSLVKRGTT